MDSRSLSRNNVLVNSLHPQPTLPTSVGNMTIDSNWYNIGPAGLFSHRGRFQAIPKWSDAVGLATRAVEKTGIFPDILAYVAGKRGHIPIGNAIHESLRFNVDLEGLPLWEEAIRVSNMIEQYDGKDLPFNNYGMSLQESKRIQSYTAANEGTFENEDETSKQRRQASSKPTPMNAAEYRNHIGKGSDYSVFADGERSFYSTWSGYENVYASLSCMVTSQRSLIYNDTDASISTHPHAYFDPTVTGVPAPKIVKIYSLGGSPIPCSVTQTAMMTFLSWAASPHYLSKYAIQCGMVSEPTQFKDQYKNVEADTWYPRSAPLGAGTGDLYDVTSSLAHVGDGDYLGQLDRDVLKYCVIDELDHTIRNSVTNIVATMSSILFDPTSNIVSGLMFLYNELGGIYSRDHHKMYNTCGAGDDMGTIPVRKLSTDIQSCINLLSTSFQQTGNSVSFADMITYYPELRGMYNHMHALLIDMAAFVDHPDLVMFKDMYNQSKPEERVQVVGTQQVPGATAPRSSTVREKLINLFGRRIKSTYDTPVSIWNPSFLNNITVSHIVGCANVVDIHIVDSMRTRLRTSMAFADNIRETLRMGHVIDQRRYIPSIHTTQFEFMRATLDPMAKDPIEEPRIIELALGNYLIDHPESLNGYLVGLFSRFYPIQEIYRRDTVQSYPYKQYATDALDNRSRNVEDVDKKSSRLAQSKVDSFASMPPEEYLQAEFQTTNRTIVAEQVIKRMTSLQSFMLSLARITTSGGWTHRYSDDVYVNSVSPDISTMGSDNQFIGTSLQRPSRMYNINITTNVESGRESLSCLPKRLALVAKSSSQIDPTNANKLVSDYTNLTRVFDRYKKMVSDLRTCNTNTDLESPFLTAQFASDRASFEKILTGIDAMMVTLITDMNTYPVGPAWVEYTTNSTGNTMYDHYGAVLTHMNRILNPTQWGISDIFVVNTININYLTNSIMRLTSEGTRIPMSIPLIDLALSLDLDRKMSYLMLSIANKLMLHVFTTTTGRKVLVNGLAPRVGASKFGNKWGNGMESDGGATRVGIGGAAGTTEFTNTSQIIVPTLDVADYDMKYDQMTPPSFTFTEPNKLKSNWVSSRSQLAVDYDTYVSNKVLVAPKITPEHIDSTFVAGIHSMLFGGSADAVPAPTPMSVAMNLYSGKRSAYDHTADNVLKDALDKLEDHMKFYRVFTTRNQIIKTFIPRNISALQKTRSGRRYTAPGSMLLQLNFLINLAANIMNDIPEADRCTFLGEADMAHIHTLIETRTEGGHAKGVDGMNDLSVIHRYARQIYSTCKGEFMKTDYNRILGEPPSNLTLSRVYVAYLLVCIQRMMVGTFDYKFVLALCNPQSYVSVVNPGVSIEYPVRCDNTKSIFMSVAILSARPMIDAIVASTPMKTYIFPRFTDIASINKTIPDDYTDTISCSFTRHDPSRHPIVHYGNPSTKTYHYNLAIKTVVRKSYEDGAAEVQLLQLSDMGAYEKYDRMMRRFVSAVIYIYMFKEMYNARVEKYAMSKNVNTIDRNSSMMVAKSIYNDVIVSAIYDGLIIPIYDGFSTNWTTIFADNSKDTRSATVGDMISETLITAVIFVKTTIEDIANRISFH